MGRISALTELTSLASDDYLLVLDSSANIGKKISVANAFGIPDFGFTASGETWTYSSFSSTTRLGVITVPSDATTKYSAGMWVRITQSTGGTKYGIIVAVTSTTIKVNFFSTYTLNNEAISSPNYSTANQPYGTPSLPVISTDANNWTVYDYGTKREYNKLFSPSSVGSVASGGQGTIAGGDMPVGIAPNTVHITHSLLRPSGSNQFVITPDVDEGSSSTSHTYNFRYRNITNATITGDDFNLSMRLADRVKIS